MARAFWIVIGLLAALYALRATGVFGHGWVAFYVNWVLGMACAFAFPLLLFSMFYAPGLFQELTGGISHWWQRIQSRRHEQLDLESKIARLNKSHHMALLGNFFLRQGRQGQAAEWYEKALAQEPELLDARYRLGLCRYEQARYDEAAALLEAVHAEKPDYDYGLAYLRLAQTQHQLGNSARAAEIYRVLLQFYPGQPEGCYNYALLRASEGDYNGARQLMRELIASVRLSPRFQRRRNRHFVLKARWWLWRNRGKS